MKIIVAGSRSFNNYNKLKKELNKFIEDFQLDREEITILSGGAKGADKLGEDYAILHKYKLIIIPAEWEIYGKSAGFIRNLEMAKIADACIVFWDGKSSGSQHMITLARKYKLLLRVIK